MGYIMSNPPPFGGGVQFLANTLAELYTLRELAKKTSLLSYGIKGREQFSKRRSKIEGRNSKFNEITGRLALLGRGQA